MMAALTLLVEGDREKAIKQPRISRMAQMKTKHCGWQPSISIPDRRISVVSWSYPRHP
jgi:hypothetical protein